MKIIPAIDIRDGVFAYPIMKRDVSIFASDDCGEIAAVWENLGAERIHITDRDGVFLSKPENLDTIASVCRRVSIPVQAGGGIQSGEDVKNLFDRGVSTVVLDSRWINSPRELEKVLELYGDRLAVGIQHREGQAVLEGWNQPTGRQAADLAAEFEKAGIRRIILHDASRSGYDSGEKDRVLAATEKAVLTVSGGISSLPSVRDIAGASPRIDSVIIGKAFYRGFIPLENICFANI